MDRFHCRAMTLIAVFVVCFLPSAPAQFATSVVSYQQGGTSGGGLFNQANVLGGPRGAGINAGSLDVLSLGQGGNVLLGFSVTLVDGPGEDFTVFENPFYSPIGTFNAFAEAAFVEVSTNGVDFARFPSFYAGPAAPQSAIGSLPVGTFSGLTGGLPVLVNTSIGLGDAFDPTVSGGEAFDLADLAADPLVASGVVDLTAIHFVRVVDVVAGVDADSTGQLIYDNGGLGSADIDAVAVLHHAGNVNVTGPTVSVGYDAAGRLQVTLSDPDGLGDLDPLSFRASFNLVPVTAANFQAFFPFVAVTSTAVTFTSAVVVQGQGALGVFAVSLSDLTGTRSASQFFIQG